MKKRKPPIAAITILLICITVAFMFNYEAGRDPNAPPETAPQPSEVKAGQPQPTQPVSSTAAAAQKEMGESKPAAAKPNPKKMMMKGMVPTIANPAETNNKPVQSDTQISSQWYQPDSSRANTK
jgi:hypothetical protein